MNEAIQQRIVALEKKIGRDGKSPLFAQLANFYLESDRAKEALRICDAGLSHFPFYTTGHLIKGKALIALDMQAEDRREFEFVLSFLPKNEAVTTLLKNISPSEEILSPKPLEQPQQNTHELHHLQPPATERAQTITPPSQPAVNPEIDDAFSRSERITQEPLQTSKPIAETPSGSSFFDMITQKAYPTKQEDSFGLGVNNLTIEPTIKPEPSTSNGFDSLISEPPAEVESELQSKEELSGFEYIPASPEIISTTPSAPIEEESFKKYATRRRAELTGENTISLEDYFNNVQTSISQMELPAIEPPTVTQPLEEIQPEVKETEPIESPTPMVSMELPEEVNQEPTPFISFDTPNVAEEAIPSPAMDLPETSSPFIPPASSNEPDKIEEIATKLQTAKRITPIIDITPVINIVEKESPPPSQQDSPPIGFVTPTLAEIYAKQGWYDDAIKAYKTLVRTKPGEKERFEKRIAELEELKKQSGK